MTKKDQGDILIPSKELKRAKGVRTISNEEMLQEMSNILQVQLHPIKEQLDRVEIHVDGLENCIRDEVLPRLERLEFRVGKLETGVEKLKQSVKVLETDTGKLMLTTEDYILPTLGELKECYTGAYERYSKWSDGIEGMSQDVDILKRVVAVHSRKLKHIF